MPARTVHKRRYAMSQFFGFLALLVAGAGTPADDAQCQITPAGYRAEVAVSMGGITQRGLLIVTRDGVHLEQLDENVVRYIHGAIRPKPTSPMGWDDRPLRAGPMRIVWGRLGQTEVLAEIHTPDATIRVTQHRLLSAR
jgi:hypothetical protein